MLKKSLKKEKHDKILIISTKKTTKETSRLLKMMENIFRTKLDVCSSPTLSSNYNAEDFSA